MRLQTHRSNLSSGAEHTRLWIHFILVKREGKIALLVQFLASVPETTQLNIC